MNKSRILVIGRHAEIMQIVLRLINQNDEWSGDGCLSDEEAKSMFIANAYDLVLLGGGISESEEQVLRAFFSEHKPKVPVVQHYGGGSGLLYNEIKEALSL